MATDNNDDESCDCLVCAIRRELERRYPDGMTEEATHYAASCLGGVVAGLVKAAGPEVLITFSVRYLKARAKLDERDEKETQQ